MKLYKTVHCLMTAALLWSLSATLPATLSAQETAAVPEEMAILKHLSLIHI